MSHRMLWCLVTLCTLGVAPTAVAGSGGRVPQEVAESFAELPRYVNVGDTVEVTDESNGQIRGEVVEFSGPEIHLRRDEQTIVLTEDSVREIQVRYGDSLKNGALIGGLVGAGFAAAWIAGGVSEGVEPGVLVAGSAIYVGAGLGIGIGIDALRKGWKLVYASPTAQNGIDISFYPLVTADRRGLVVRVCF